MREANRKTGWTLLMALAACQSGERLAGPEQRLAVADPAQVQGEQQSRYAGYLLQGVLPFSEAWDVNQQKRSVGVTFMLGEEVDGLAILWDAPPALTPLLIGRPAGFVAAVAYGVTNGTTVPNSRIVGTAFGPTNAGWSWTTATSFVSLPVPAGTTASEAKDINNSNTIVGSFVRNNVRRAFKTRPTTGFTVLAVPAGYSASGAEAIADNNVVVGWAMLGGVRRAARWSASGAFFDMGLGVPASAYDVNANGDATGEMPVGGSTLGFAFRGAVGILTPFAPPVVSGRGLSDKGRYVGLLSGNLPGTWTPSSSIVRLPLLPPWTGGRANAVNKCGDAVGMMNNGGIPSQAVFWKIQTCD